MVGLGLVWVGRKAVGGPSQHGRRPRPARQAGLHTMFVLCKRHHHSVHQQSMHRPNNRPNSRGEAGRRPPSPNPYNTQSTSQLNHAASMHSRGEVRRDRAVDRRHRRLVGEGEGAGDGVAGDHAHTVNQEAVAGGGAIVVAAQRAGPAPLSTQGMGSTQVRSRVAARGADGMGRARGRGACTRSAARRQGPGQHPLTLRRSARQSSTKKQTRSCRGQGAPCGYSCVGGSAGAALGRALQHPPAPPQGRQGAPVTHPKVHSAAVALCSSKRPPPKLMG